jgi:hypothetical protein
MGTTQSGSRRQHLLPSKSPFSSLSVDSRRIVRHSAISSDNATGTTDARAVEGEDTTKRQQIPKEEEEEE